MRFPQETSRLLQLLWHLKDPTSTMESPEAPAVTPKVWQSWIPRLWDLPWCSRFHGDGRKSPHRILLPVHPGLSLSTKTPLIPVNPPRMATSLPQLWGHRASTGLWMQARRISLLTHTACAQPAELELRSFPHHQHHCPLPSCAASQLLHLSQMVEALKTGPIITISPSNMTCNLKIIECNDFLNE